MIRSRASGWLVVLALASILAPPSRTVHADQGATSEAGQALRHSTYPSQDSVVRAAISFARLAPDASISALAQRRRLRVVGVRYFVQGLYATHQLRNPAAPDSVLRGGREAVIRSLNRGRQTSANRTDRFLSAHTREQISSDTALLREAESIVASGDQLRSAISHARATGPIVYGLEVEGARADIEAMQRDPLVASVEFARSVSGRMVVPSPILPQEASRGGLDVSTARAMARNVMLDRLQQYRAP